MPCPHGPAPLGPIAAKIVVGLLVAIGVAVDRRCGRALAEQGNGRHPAAVPERGRRCGHHRVRPRGFHAHGACGSPSAGGVLTRRPDAARQAAGECVQSPGLNRSGPNAGADTLLEFSGGPGQPQLAADDHVRLTAGRPGRHHDLRLLRLRAQLAAGGLAAAFAIVVIAVARWRGLRALVGIVVAFGVLMVFLLPALRDGAPADPCRLVASGAILYAVIYLAHGVSCVPAPRCSDLDRAVVAAGLSWAAIESCT